MKLGDLKKTIAEKKAALDAMRPLRPDALAALEHHYDVEITYSSNAIEGNTLTAGETQLVIEKGITIGGKPLKDHLEAIDHYEAVLFIRSLAGEGRPLAEVDVRSLHALVVKRSAPEIAGRYADRARLVLTDSGRHAFPSPAEVPGLMGEFAAWLAAAPITPQTAFDAHRRLVGVHPFNDGNGRTARLLMNLLLIQSGYPPISIRPEDRPAYISALAKEQAGGSAEDFGLLMYARLDVVLEEYVSALREASP